MTLCPHCGQTLPIGGAYLTPRELDVLTEWWLTASVKKAAVNLGIGEQRAKNLLVQARNRNNVQNTAQLLALHIVDVRAAVGSRVPQNKRKGEAA
jgi:DNA-binding CsgD family transcriptional regulator